MLKTNSRSEFRDRTEWSFFISQDALWFSDRVNFKCSTSGFLWVIIWNIKPNGTIMEGNASRDEIIHCKHKILNIHRRRSKSMCSFSKMGGKIELD